jgi:hypothetical protein
MRLLKRRAGRAIVAERPVRAAEADRFMPIPSLAILGPSVARQRGLLPTPAQRLVNGDQARGCLRPALCEAVLGLELRSLGIQNLEEMT